jgi:hypothetical protein
MKKRDAMMKERPIDSGRIHYMGGHKAYPEPKWTEIFFYEDRIVIDECKITIPYKQIKDIDNSKERKRHEDWVALGLIGLFWKRNAIYTIIEYDDGVDIQRVVIDFQNNANYAQGLIYKKMLESRKNKK